MIKNFMIAVAGAICGVVAFLTVLFGWDGMLFVLYALAGGNVK